MFQNVLRMTLEDCILIKIRCSADAKQIHSGNITKINVFKIATKER